MKMYDFIKIFVKGFAFAIIVYSQAFAACPPKSGYSQDPSTGYCIKANACDGKCTYTYDPVSTDFWATKNADVPAGEPVLLTGVLPDGTNIRNATIGEGITGFASYYIFFNLGAANGRGTLTLPSTFNDTVSNKYVSAIYGTTFATYDLSAMKNASFQVGGASCDVIMNDDANLNITGGCNIVCKGNKQLCRNQFPQTAVVTTSYYSGLDENGNYIEWSDDGLAVYADSTKAKPLGTYDFEGNAIDTYKYDGAGNLTAAYKNGVATYKRTSYTPVEAAAATRKGNDNKITLTFK